MTKRSALLWVVFTFVGLYFLLHHAFLDASIGGTSHGQQAAQHAVSEGFVRNDLNFSQPQTRALNYRSEGYRTDEAHTVPITAAHFPIHAYIPAVIHKITGGELLTIQKTYTLLYGFIGLLFLFWLSLRLTNHLGKSLFIVVFVATAPLFAFYQSSVLNLIPSLANIFIGSYYLHRFFTKHRQKHAWLGLLFLLLATLSATYFFFTLLTGIVLVIFAFLDQGKPVLKNGIIASAFLIPLVLSELYFFALESSYGSQFPGFLTIWSQDQTVNNNIIDGWKMHYFTVFQTVFFVILLIVFIVQKRKGSGEKRLAKVNYRFGFISSLGLLCGVFYPIQALFNDTFFLQAVFVPLVFLLIFLVQGLNISILERYPKFLFPAVLLLLFVLMSEGNWTQMVRHEKKRMSEGNLRAFSFLGADELLKKLDIPTDAVIYVVDQRNDGTGHELLMNAKRNGFIFVYGYQNQRIQAGGYVITSLQAPSIDNFTPNGYELLGHNGSVAVLKVND